MPDHTVNGTVSEPICGKCRHYRPDPLNPADLSHKFGRCREGPPHLTIAILAGPGGQPVMQHFSDYPGMPPSFPACSRFAVVPITIDLEA